ncbi:ribonuclease P protein component [Candidatus Synchoanobacter obligatus]|uniref:Ribonuclease P protein component n=1 Tax=Candidatus Synchoanobacter obligatus TaxID=2919597 RepID=A0ABT1L533_9GAMM|nr:ribonuclease P protein component [Candidatus Synchoanobacter obligatus]MCP8352204.1 ribonuclease P protein component [Candidatus Synchoanobacter obligatus]
MYAKGQPSCTQVLKKIKQHPLEIVHYNAPHNCGVCIIPKRTVPSAVVRNRLRRQITSALHVEFKKEQYGGVRVRIVSAPRDNISVFHIVSECLENLRS